MKDMESRRVRQLRIIPLVMLIAAIIAIMSMSGCGEDKQPVTYGLDSSDSSGGGQTGGVGGTITEPTGSGFTNNHAVEAGFGMGTDTLDGIKSRFGEPSSAEQQDYTASSVITAKYPFGLMELEGTPDSVPVLTYVNVTGDGAAAPCGIKLGDDMSSVADIMYKGSAKLINETAEQQLILYGAEGDSSWGKYTMLTIEFTGSETPEVYSLDYVAPAYEPGKRTRLTFFFDTEMKCCRYTLRYE